MSTAQIGLRRERSVGDVLNATFEFIRTFPGPLLKSLLYISGPLVILGQILVTLAGSEPSGAGFIALFAGQVCTGFGSLLATTVVLGAVRLYDDAGGEALSVDRIWDLTREYFGRVLGAALTLGFLMAVVGAVIAVAVVLVQSPVAVGVMFVLALPFVFYAAVKMGLLFPALIFETGGPIDSIRRSYTLTNDFFWKTFGVLFLSGLIAGVINSLFSIPVFVMQMFNTGGGAAPGMLPLSIAAGIIAGAGSVVLSAIPTLAGIFHYFNLIERKEHVSLQEDIDQIGGGAAPVGASTPTSTEATAAGASSSDVVDELDDAPDDASFDDASSDDTSTDADASAERWGR